MADFDELTALLEPMRKRSRGVVALLPGGVMTNAQMFDLQRHIGRPFTWTALLTFAGSDYHEQVMAEHAAARASGVDVWPQVSCRPLVFQMNLAEPFSLNTFPNFAALMDCPVEERTAAYRDPAWRSATQEQITSGRFSLFNPASLSVAESTTRPDLVGRSVVELAEEQDVTPLDILLDLSLADDLTSRFWSVMANNNQEGIAYLLPRDDVLLGLADSGAHVSQLCDACFATDLLGNWVRDRQVMSLEHAVHKLTAEPARVYGLDDRGSGGSRDGRRPGGVRSGHSGTRSAPTGGGLPCRRRAADRGCAGRHDPHAGQWCANSGRRPFGSRRSGATPGHRASQLAAGSFCSRPIVQERGERTKDA